MWRLSAAPWDALTPFDILPAVWVTSLCSPPGWGSRRRGYWEGSGGNDGLHCSRCFCFWQRAALALGKRKNAYDLAPCRSGADGLKLLVTILPALVLLLTAVHMLRASGAVALLSRFFAPVFSFFGIPPETAMLVLIRPISGSAALAVGGRTDGAVRRGFPNWPHGSGDAGFHGDDLLHHQRLLSARRASKRPATPSRRRCSRTLSAFSWRRGR